MLSYLLSVELYVYRVKVLFAIPSCLTIQVCREILEQVFGRVGCICDLEIKPDIINTTKFMNN